MGIGGNSATAPRLSWPVVLSFWALIVAVFTARALLSAGQGPLFADTDDAMRLVVVRDFLNGQDWFDHAQHRMNTPYGAELHWSRLVDLPLATLLAALRPVFGGTAEIVLAYLWPALLLLVLLYLSGKLTLRLVGEAGLLPAMVLPALSPAIMAEFAPGRLDHHSIQILLTLAMTWAAVESLRSRWAAVGAGLAAATAVAVGTESVPIVAGLVLCFGLMWVFRPERVVALRWFGLSFAGFAMVHLLIAEPPSKWFVPACDVLSSYYVAAAIAVGIGFFLLSLLPLGKRPVPWRLAAGVVVGGIAVAVLFYAFPRCQRGPYSDVDPELIGTWIGRIVEAKLLWESVAALPAYSIAVGLPPILALGVVIWRVTRGPAAGRADWLVYSVMLAVAVVVMVAQVRGARAASGLAIPPAAWLIAAARARYQRDHALRHAVELVGSWVIFAGVAIAVTVNGVTTAAEAIAPRGPLTFSANGPDRRPCLMPSAFAELAAMPPERVMTPIDLGSHLLMETPHSVVAAPYHRNQMGVRDAIAFFNRPIDTVRPILDQRGVSLVVVCPQMAEMIGGFDPAPDSFVDLMAKGELPAWLHEVSLPDAPLKIYAVLPAAQ